VSGTVQTSPSVAQRIQRRDVLAAATARGDAADESSVPSDSASMPCAVASGSVWLPPQAASTAAIEKATQTLRRLCAASRFECMGRLLRDDGTHRAGAGPHACHETLPSAATA
jgi:hypothetical protein